MLISQVMEGTGCPSAMPDNASGTEAAVEHLLEHGHRQIAFAGNLIQDDVQERYAAYRATLRKHGIEPDESLFFPACDNLQSGGTGAGRLLLSTGLRPDALVAATDDNAIGIMRVLREAGWSLPADLAIVGFDNTEEAAQVTPALTTVAVSLDRLGELAADLLLRRIDGVPVASGIHLAAATMVMRHSCGCGKRAAVPSGISVPLSDGLRIVLLPETHPLPSLLRRLTEAVSSVVAFFAAVVDGSVEPGALDALARELHELGPRHETIRRVIEIVRDYIDELAAAGAPRQVLDRALLDLSLALGEFDAHANTASRLAASHQMGGHYEVGVALLRSDQRDPATLSWLARTGATAGCLGMWLDNDGQGAAGELTITGVYGDDPALANLVGARMPAQSFPPDALIDQINSADGEIVHVLQVRSGGTHWGILAVPSSISELSIEGREPFNDWTAFLAVAFEQKRDRDNLSAVYQRERELAENLRVSAEHLRVSEERYALASLAANDGLWDWDLSDDTVFYSARWSATVGISPTNLESSPGEWLSRVHPDDRAALDAALEACRRGEIAVLLHEHRVRTTDTSYRWMSCRAIGVPGPGGTVARLVGALTDIDDRKQLEERMRHAAHHDALTGLPNRVLFLDQLEQVFDRSSRMPSQKYAVLFCDLDGFKAVNDTLGHHIGDLLLSAVADRLTNAVRRSDLAARLGGDEFALLLADVDDSELALVIDRVHRAIDEPFDLEGHRVTIGTSVGVATSDAAYGSPAEILREADAAMYRAKTIAYRGVQPRDTSVPRS